MENVTTNPEQEPEYCGEYQIRKLSKGEKSIALPRDMSGTYRVYKYKDKKVLLIPVAL